MTDDDRIEIAGAVLAGTVIARLARMLAIQLAAATNRPLSLLDGFETRAVAEVRQGTLLRQSDARPMIEASDLPRAQEIATAIVADFLAELRDALAEARGAGDEEG